MYNFEEEQKKYIEEENAENERFVKTVQKRERTLKRVMGWFNQRHHYDWEGNRIEKIEDAGLWMFSALDFNLDGRHVTLLIEDYNDTRRVWRGNNIVHYMSDNVQFYVAYGVDEVDYIDDDEIKYLEIDFKELIRDANELFKATGEDLILDFDIVCETYDNDGNCDKICRRRVNMY